MLTTSVQSRHEVNKACPVVVRVNAGVRQFLAFRHPLAGKQLVKGTVKPGESIAHASIRELREESGLIARVDHVLGVWSSGFEGQVWGFCLMQPISNMADEFSFYTEDDGGHLFEFFWQPFGEELTEQWHPLFRRAVGAFSAFLRP